MKNTIIILAILMFGLNVNAQDGGVEVEILDVVAEWGGSVKVALFEQDGFPTTGKAIATKTVLVRDIKAKVIFENIPAGQYAIAVYQDINGDDKLNRKFYGAPTEPYAFSNNVFGRRGPPNFEAVTFTVESSTATKLKIHLKE